MKEAKTRRNREFISKNKKFKKPLEKEFHRLHKLNHSSKMKYSLQAQDIKAVLKV
jgi:hypothetical protein